MAGWTDRKLNSYIRPCYKQVTDPYIVIYILLKQQLFELLSEMGRFPHGRNLARLLHRQTLPDTLNGKQQYCRIYLKVHNTGKGENAGKGQFSYT